MKNIQCNTKIKFPIFQKELQQLLESIQRYHKSELGRYQQRLDELEKQCAGSSSSQVPVNSEDTGADDKKQSIVKEEPLIREEESSLDEDIILLDAGPSNDESTIPTTKEGREKMENNAG